MKPEQASKGKSLNADPPVLRERPREWGRLVSAPTRFTGVMGTARSEGGPGNGGDPSWRGGRPRTPTPGGGCERESDGDIVLLNLGNSRGGKVPDFCMLLKREKVRRLAQHVWVLERRNTKIDIIFPRKLYRRVKKSWSQSHVRRRHGPKLSNECDESSRRASSLSDLEGKIPNFEINRKNGCFICNSFTIR